MPEFFQIFLAPNLKIAIHNSQIRDFLGNMITVVLLEGNADYA